MRYLLFLAFTLFSTIGSAQSEKIFVCDTKDTSDTIELDSSYTVVIANQVAYIKAGAQSVSLRVLVIDHKETTIYLGEDTKFDYAFYSSEGVLSILGKSSINAPYDFICHSNL